MMRFVINERKRLRVKHRLPQCMQQGQTGFTLIELMIVVAIIGVIAAFAYPAYMDSVRKSRRSDAKSFLMDIAARQEQFFNDNKTYTTDPSRLGRNNTSPEGYYTIVITDGNPGDGASNSIARDYLITATPPATSAQIQDARCQSLTYSSAGIKGSSPSPSTTCW